MPLGEIDISFYRDDVGVSRSPTSRSSTPRASTSRSRRRRSCSSTTSSTRVAPRARRSRRFSTTAGRPRSSSRYWSTAGTASFRSGPTMSERTCPPRASERVNVRLEEQDGVDEVELDELGSTGGRCQPYEASALDRRPHARRHRAHPDRCRRELRGGRRARHQEGPDPARPHDRQPLLRVEHAHELVVRAGREAALRGRREHQVRRLVRRQGRVAQGHDRDAVGLRSGRDRDPGPLGRRGDHSSPAIPRRRSSMPGDGKHEHPSQALLDVFTLHRRLRCIRSTGSTSGSSATSSTAASPAPTCSPSRAWAPRSPSAVRRR